jgi:hypothetical protein
MTDHTIRAIRDAANPRRLRRAVRDYYRPCRYTPTCFRWPDLQSRTQWSGRSHSEDSVRLYRSRSAAAEKRLTAAASAAGWDNWFDWIEETVLWSHFYC